VTTVAVVLAFGLLVAGVVGAFVPNVPGAFLSIAGVLVYWWGTGYTEPGTVVLVALLVTGVLALFADWAGGVVAAKVGGASTVSAIVAGIVGVLFLFAAGPLGMLVAAATTVFAIEYARRRDARRGMRAAGAYVLGFFASALAQAVLTGSILLAMIVVAL